MVDLEDVVEAVVDIEGIVNRLGVKPRGTRPAPPVDGKTVTPVARIAYGFGGEFGQGRSGDEAGLASGVGGGVVTRPIGVLEITERETRFVRLSDWKRIALGVALGVGL
jgi:uncharacterized spore protein YtfJ